MEERSPVRSPRNVKVVEMTADSRAFYQEDFSQCRKRTRLAAQAFDLAPMVPA